MITLLFKNHFRQIGQGDAVVPVYVSNAYCLIIFFPAARGKQQEEKQKNIVFSSCLFPFLLFSKSLCYSIQNDGQDDYCDTAFET